MTQDVVIWTTRDRAEHLLRALKWLHEQHADLADSRATQDFHRLAHDQCRAVVGALAADVQRALKNDPQTSATAALDDAGRDGAL